MVGFKINSANFSILNLHRRFLMTRVYQVFTGFILLFFLSGCIERYYPEGEEFRSGTLVVIAHLDNSGSEQTIFISRSTNLELPTRYPVTGCLVEVDQKEGASLEFMEDEMGRYVGTPSGDFFRTGNSYKLRLVTPDARRYESGFEQMYPAPAIDSIYWKREESFGQEPGTSLDGIRFYMDYEMEKDSAKYLRWQLVETYEYHNPDYEATEVYDREDSYPWRRTFSPIPRDSRWNTCWVTNLLPDIFTKDLGNVEGDLYREMPLHFVSNRTQRLQTRYSLLVRQFALSSPAFLYWDGLKNNLQSSGGLYDSQPSLTPGNICNVDNEDEIVIGYFCVSGVSEKRAFVSQVPGMSIISDPTFCFPGPLPFSFARLSNAFLPYYLATLSVDGESVYGSVQKHCIDCRENKNSVNSPPEYW